MSRLQCLQCKKAKKGEPLYYVDEEILCVYCGMARLTELTHANVQYAGYVGEEQRSDDDE